MKKEKKTAILAYVPVIHKGYLDFFNKNEGDIFIFGEDLITSYVHLTRDIRAVSPVDMVKALEALLPKRNISLANIEDLKSWSYKKIIMPDDEVCHDIANKYLNGKEIEYQSTFLRWNKVITFKEYEIPANRVITEEKLHKELIQKAHKEAQKSSDWWRQIASLIVKDGQIVAEAHNHHLPTDFHLTANGDPRSNFDAGQHQEIFTSIHSEAAAIAEAAKKGISLEGSSIYATTFPCPNCARLIAKSGIKKVFYSKGYSLLDAEKILNHFEVEIIMVKD